jgi:DNA-binding Lrp family transcriptional regulator
MPRALVFINTKSNAVEVVQALKKVDGVSEAHSSRGMYDAVVMVQAESFSQMKDIVSKHIRRIDNVKETLTLTLVETPAT